MNVFIFVYNLNVLTFMPYLTIIFRLLSCVCFLCEYFVKSVVLFDRAREVPMVLRVSLVQLGIR